MSIINQMLRDLDARRAESAPADQPALRGLAVGGRLAHHRTPALVWGLLVLVVVLAATLVHVVAAEREPVPALPAASATPLAKLERPAPVVPPQAAERPAQPAATGTPAPQPEPPAQAIPTPEEPAQPSVVALARTTAPAAEPGGEQHRQEGTRVPAPAAVQKQRRPLSTAQRVEAALAEASAAIRRGDQTAAAQALGRALSMEPSHAGARELLAKVYIAGGRVVEARAVLGDGIRLQPGHPGLRKLQARVLVEQGEPTAAIALLDNDRPAVAADTEYWALLGGLAYQHGDYATARTSYQELVKFQPASGTWWLGLAMAAEAQSDNSVARDAYQRALQSGALTPSLKQFALSRLPALADSADAL